LKKKYDMPIKREKSTRVIATERKIKLNGWNCEIGTMNKNNPTSSFIKISGYCNPGSLNINESMTRFQFAIGRQINKMAKQLLGNLLPKNFIPIKNVEWTDRNIFRQYNKWTYFCIEVTFYHSNIEWTESFKDDLKLISYAIIDYLEEYEDGIHFNKKRV
jgi:hypothetical protein